MNTSIKKLVEETLNYSREYRFPDSCFVLNQAAQELEKCGEVALPAIEEAIRKRVVPTSESSTDHHELMAKHYGLLNLWMAYVAIAGHQNRERVIDFMRSLDGPVLGTAILSLRSTWPYDEGTRIAMPKPFLEFIQEVAKHRSESPAQVAKDLLSRLTLSDS